MIDILQFFDIIFVFVGVGQVVFCDLLDFEGEVFYLMDFCVDVVRWVFDEVGVKGDFVVVLQLIIVVWMFEDFGLCCMYEFGCSFNFFCLVVWCVGVDFVEVVYSLVGGVMLQSCVNWFVEWIVCGEFEVVFFCGVENIVIVIYVMCNGVKFSFDEEVEGLFDDEGFGDYWFDKY